MSNLKTITISLPRRQVFLAGAVVIVACLALAFFYVRAAFIEPDFAPGASNQDFSENIMGANSTDNDFNSSLVAANPDGSLIERLDSLQDDYVSSFYAGISIPQRYQSYDDYNCEGTPVSGNNGATTSAACSSTSDPEETAEEGVWASTTDTNLNSAQIASGMVFRDLRTGIYWSDCYDTTSGGGSCDTATNTFQAVLTAGMCTAAEVNAGICDVNARATSSRAINICKDLSLDSNGDGTDETDWYLPSQKQLLQAYINGAANNLPNISSSYYYWSATENYSSATNAWHVALAHGYTNTNSKTNNSYVRCVR